MESRIKTSAMRFAVSLGLLALLGVGSAIPAVASSIDLNTGNGGSAYTITADTLVPPEGTTATVVASLGSGWINNLTSEWISPLANQSNPPTEGDAGYVIYQTTFSLPSNLSPGSTISIEFAADDWISAISLNGNTSFYNGPTGAGCTDSTGVCTSDPMSWTSDTTLTISSAVDDELVSGPNTLSFRVWNTGGGSDNGGGPTGLDAQVSVAYAVTPEPSSLLLFGTGLLGLAGAVRRKLRR